MFGHQKRCIWGIGIADLHSLIWTLSYRVSWLSFEFVMSEIIQQDCWYSKKKYGSYKPFQDTNDYCVIVSSPVCLRPGELGDGMLNMKLSTCFNHAKSLFLEWFEPIVDFVPSGLWESPLYWWYPLVNVYIAMENHRFIWLNPRTKSPFSIAMRLC